MREVSRDDKWNEEADGRMQSVQDDMNDSMTVLEGHVAGGPTEAELVVIALLMRLYDLNLALLAETSQQRADEVYDAHKKGEHFNPPIFVPQVDED